MDAEITAIVRTAERTNDVLERSSYEKIHEWIGDSFRNEYQEALLMPKNSVEQLTDRALVLAEKGRDLSQLLYSIGKIDDVAAQWIDKLNTTILDPHKPSSLVNCAGRGWQNEASNGLIGPISVVTFYEFLEGTRPEDASHQRISQIIADPETDVHDKVDIKLRDEHSRTIKLVQLKASDEGNIVIAQVNRRSDGGSDIPINAKMDAKAARKMLDRAEKERRDPKNSGYAVETYYVEIPSPISKQIGNIYGKIGFSKRGTNDLIRDQALRTFQDQAHRSGFYRK